MSPKLNVIVVVDDVPRARKFYEEVLDCKVVSDFGEYNVAFEGGLAFYKKGLFIELAGALEMTDRSNNFCVYLEVENLDFYVERLNTLRVEVIHPAREQPWGQRAMRFYDPDQHIVELAEDMDVVVRRLYRETGAVEAVARKTGYAEAEVRRMLDLPA